MRTVVGSSLVLGALLIPSLLLSPARAGGPERAPRAGSAPAVRLAQNQIPVPDPMAGQAPQPMTGTPTAPATTAAPAAPGAPQVYTPAPPTAEVPKPFHGSMSFEAGAGRILTLNLPVASIFVADPKVAEVKPVSTTSLFVFGIGPGHTTIAAVDALGRLLADYQVTVQPSGFAAREAQAAIRRLIPGSQVEVKTQGKGIMLMGGVARASDAAQAMSIAKGFLTAEGGLVDNQMTIAAPTQVTLQVRIAEMKRSIVRNLGIDWSAAGQFGRIAPLAGIPGAATHLLQTTFNGTGCATGRGCLDNIINALAKDGLAHILAEPNLTVMSGQPASFQAGGEFPYSVVTGTGSSATATIAFKPYGVMLNFVPTVLNDGRINLHVRPEVSALDTANQVSASAGSASTLTVPALTVRRAETTVELGSGESIAIAGMLQSSNSDSGSGIPFLGDTPILGGLFKTNSMAREQTELVIIVTPVLTRPVRNVAQLQLPADGYRPARDLDRLMLMRQMPNRDGTTQGRAPGEAGFIVR